jgi:hypothetical protein
MHNTFFNVVGYSGAGKDTVASIIQNTVGGEQVKFGYPGKRLFESIYGIPVGLMDDRVRRLELVPGTDHTYLDSFIFWYQNQGIMFPPNYFLDQVKAKVKAIQYNDLIANIISTDARTFSEVKYINTEAPQKVVHIMVIREDSKMLLSDADLQTNWNYCRKSEHEYHYIANNGSLQLLTTKVNILLGML